MSVKVGDLIRSNRELGGRSVHEAKPITIPSGEACAVIYASGDAVTVEWEHPQLAETVIYRTKNYKDVFVLKGNETHYEPIV